MKVLHIGKYYPPHWGGMETALKDICEVLAPRVDLEALVASDSPAAVTETVGGVRVSRLASFGTLFSQPIVAGLLRRLHRVNADLVHLHEPNPLAMIAFLLSGSAAPLVVHYHSDIVRQRRLRWLYRPWLEWGLSRAAAIVAGSEELVRSSPVLARWRHKCVVIPFGIDLTPFLAIERGTATVGTSAAEPPLILAVGRLAYYKGFHYLVEAMRSLPGARLAIVGEGEERNALERRIAALGLASRIELPGRVPEAQLAGWYQRASLFCLPSCERSEAFGLVQLEAMGAGLPVVSTDLPTGMRAVNRHEETGLVVPPHDVPALAAALARLSTDASLRCRLGAAARRRALTLYSRERMGAEILALYQRVCPREEAMSWSI